MLVTTACDLRAEDRFRRWAGERLGEVDAVDGFDLVPEPTVERVIRGAELADSAHRVALEHHQAQDTVGCRLEVPMLGVQADASVELLELVLAFPRARGRDLPELLSPARKARQRNRQLRHIPPLSLAKYYDRSIRRSSAPQITTTSYAILGVLAIAPRTAYELAAEMRHCFEYFWPRAGARVYAEAKQLAADGLAATSEEHIGRRRRTTYRITPAGRRALRQWLTEPPKPVALEFEALIKVYVARLGTKDDLATTLEAVGADAAFMLSVAQNVRQVYLDGCAPFQDDYVHTWVFVYDFLTDYFDMLHRWAARTAATVEEWRDLDPDGKRDAALRTFEAKLARGAMSSPPDDPQALPGAWQQGRPRPRRSTRPVAG